MASYSTNSSKLYALCPQSQRFDELAVALPNHIDSPTLKKLVHNIQISMAKRFAFDEVVQDSISQNNDDERDNEIGYAKAILNRLLDTENSDASVLVAITNEASPKILLTRRAGHLNAHAGEVSFAGGKHEESDRNNVVTALREACEETALPPSKVQLIGQLQTQTSKSGISVRPIVALVEPNIAYVPELGEIDSIFWADLETLMQQPTTDYHISYEQDGRHFDVLTPCWVVDNNTVWGLTGRILADLLKAGFGIQTEWYYHLAN